MCDFTTLVRTSLSRYLNESLRLRLLTCLVRNMFDRLDIILIPPQLDENVRFVRLSDCVWNGHRCLETKDSLAIHQEYARNPLVASLFKDIFRLPDAGLETYLDELEARQEHLNVSVDELRVIYGLISQHTKTTDDQCFIV